MRGERVLETDIWDRSDQARFLSEDRSDPKQRGSVHESFEKRPFDADLGEISSWYVWCTQRVAPQTSPFVYPTPNVNKDSHSQTCASERCVFFEALGLSLAKALGRPLAHKDRQAVWFIEEPKT